MKLRVPVLLVAMAVTGCSAILGLRDIDEGTDAPSNDASVDRGEDGSIVPHDASDDVAIDTGTDAGGDGSICNTAFLCDDFESQAISAKWTGGNSTTGGAKVVAARNPQTATNKYWLNVGYGGVPAAGESNLAFQFPATGVPHRSIRFTLSVNDDPYTDMPVISFVDGSGNGVRVVVNGSPFTLTAKAGTTSSSTLSFTSNTTFCLALDVNPLSGLVTLTKDGNSVNITDLAQVQNATNAKLGVAWAGADSNSKQVHYDDVVIASTPLGCP